MNAPEAGPVFVARRSYWSAAQNLVIGLFLVILAGGSIMQMMHGSGSWPAVLLFSAVAVFSCWNAWTQARDRNPMVAIGPGGLHLPTASDQPIPWSRIRRVELGRGLPGLSGGRVNFEVDAETFARLRLGQRFMGDIVVRWRGVPNAFSLIAQSLDERAGDIFAALRRYWPPPSPV